MDPRIRPSARTARRSESGPAPADARGRAQRAMCRFQRRGTIRSAVRSNTVSGENLGAFPPGRHAGNTFWRRPKTVPLLTAERLVPRRWKRHIARAALPRASVGAGLDSLPISVRRQGRIRGFKSADLENFAKNPQIRASARTARRSESGPAPADARGRAQRAMCRFQRRGTIRSAVRSGTVFGRRQNVFPACRAAANIFWRRPKTVPLLTAERMVPRRWKRRIVRRAFPRASVGAGLDSLRRAVRALGRICGYFAKFSKSAVLHPRIRPSTRTESRSESRPAPTDARGRAARAMCGFQRRGTSR